MRTVSPPITKPAMQLAHKLLRHILIYIRALHMFVWVSFHPRHINSLLFFRPLRRQKSSFSSIYKRQWCMYNLPHSYINNVKRSKLDMLASE